MKRRRVRAGLLLLSVVLGLAVMPLVMMLPHVPWFVAWWLVVQIVAAAAAWLLR